MIWIFDQWSSFEKNICTSCFQAEQENVVIVLQEDGFLPDEVKSPYCFYTQDEPHQQKKEKPLFANLLEIPDLWEIHMRYDRAEIWDEGIKKAEIDYAEPIGRHNVKTVRWMMPDGLVYKTDHFDKYGKLYYTDIIDTEGRRDIRTYYKEEKPMLMYQPGFDTYTLFQEGKVCKIYDSTQKFLNQFLHQFFPGESCIVSNHINILEMVSETGMPPCNFSSDVFILTNSDQIEHLEALICALPMMCFHIAAKTLMSDKLLNLEKYPNVTLYQGISEQKRVELLIKSTYYFDINYYQEVCNIVYEAYRYNLLIVGFDKTLHNAECILPECIFSTEDAEDMIQFLETMQTNRDALRQAVIRQNQLLK